MTTKQVIVNVAYTSLYVVLIYLFTDSLEYAIIIAIIVRIMWLLFRYIRRKATEPYDGDSSLYSGNNSFSGSTDDTNLYHEDNSFFGGGFFGGGGAGSDWGSSDSSSDSGADSGGDSGCSSGCGGGCGGD